LVLRRRIGSGGRFSNLDRRSAHERLELCAVIKGAIGLNGYVRCRRDISRRAELEAMPPCAHVQPLLSARNLVDRADVEAIYVHLRRVGYYFETKIAASRRRLRSLQQWNRLDQRGFGWGQQSWWWKGDRFFAIRDLEHVWKIRISPPPEERQSSCGADAARARRINAERWSVSASRRSGLRRTGGRLGIRRGATASSSSAAASSPPATSRALPESKRRSGTGDQHHDNHRGRPLQDVLPRITLLFSVHARKSLCSAGAWSLRGFP